MQNEPLQFDITPSQQQLDEMDRHLAFHPAEPSAAARFSPAEVELFNREGFLSPINVFEPGEIREHRSYFDELLASYLAAGKNSYAISTAHLRHGRVFDLLTEPRIVAMVVDLLGPNVVGWGSHYFCKMPGDGKRVSWHQDAGYWPLSPSKTVTVWLAIDDSDIENGCMRVVPGTHREGAIPFLRSAEVEANVLNQTIEEDPSWTPPVDVELQAGQVSIHSDLLVHGSEPNVSARRRCGLTLRYCAADVTAKLNWNLKGVVVAGAADPALWPNAQRPDQD